MFGFLLRGLLVGLSIAAPVGAIGVLCIRRTLAEGRVVGFATGLGAATADAVYGSVAAFGLTFVSNVLIGQQGWFRLIGGLFLCYLGVKTFRAAPAVQTVSLKGAGLFGAYVSTFFLTLTNPLTVLSFVAVFAGLGVGSASQDYISAGALVLGVFLGSAMWWFVLSGGASLFQSSLGPDGLRWMNRISGVVIVCFGLVALLSLMGWVGL